MSWLRYLLHGSDDLGYVSKWNAVRADEEMKRTERYCLGWAAPAQVIGNRRDEAIRADRDRRLNVSVTPARQLPFKRIKS